jgi:phosphatidylglycerophosphate synthase
MRPVKRQRGARPRIAPLTPADKVTVVRAALGVVAAVLVVLTLLGVLPASSWVLPLLLVPTFALDAVDGTVARRTGTVTERGARWDVEVDAAVLLVACLAVVPYAPWALMMGLARYLYWVGGRVRGWRSELLFSQSRRVIGGLQGVALVVAMVPIVPIWLAQVVTGIALALLVFSFGRDIRYQERQRQ